MIKWLLVVAGLCGDARAIAQDTPSPALADAATKLAVANDAEPARPTVQWTMEIQADQWWFGQDARSRAAYGDIQDGAAFRRARFGIYGDYGPAEYRIMMDFALAGRPTFTDVYLGLHDLPALGRVRAGHFFEPFSLEQFVSNRFVTFMERSLPVTAFAPARNLGVMANNVWGEKEGTWGLGIFRANSDDFGDNVGDGFESAVTARLTWLPLWDDRCDGADFVHVAVAGSYRDADAGVVRFRTQPEARFGATAPNVPFVVDTGTFAAQDYWLGGLEAACVFGRFSAQAEYMVVPVNAHKAGSPCFTGWYVLATYFLTDDRRRYNRDLGVFDRVIPRRDFVRYAQGRALDWGPGAWEVGARLSQVDLNDGAIRGGRATDLTVGINWYLNPYLRLSANYIHAVVRESKLGDNDTDAWGLRAMFEF